MPEHIKRQNSTHLGGDAHKYYGTMLAKYIKETLNGNIWDWKLRSSFYNEKV